MSLKEQKEEAAMSLLEEMMNGWISNLVYKKWQAPEKVLLNFVTLVHTHTAKYIHY